MWCNCVNLPTNKIGCMNIPYSSSPFSEITIRIKLLGNYVDFNNQDIDDAFFLIRVVDDRRASNYTILSINNGDLIVDSNDSTKLQIKFNNKMINYVGSSLFFQFFLKENGDSFPLAKGRFYKEENYL